MLFGLLVGFVCSVEFDLELPETLEEWGVFAIASVVEVLLFGLIFGHWIIGGYVVGELLGRLFNLFINEV